MQPIKFRQINVPQNYIGDKTTIGDKTVNKLPQAIMAYHTKEASSTASQVLLVSALVAVLLLAQQGATAADTLTYGALQADEGGGRNGLTHTEDQANKYSDGCEATKDCRG